jgi:sirohydrochlorin cobaltochelatase
MGPKKCVLIVAHGSREASANREFVGLVRRYRKRHPGWTISHAFLELASPSIPQALSTLSKKANRILVLPLFLFSAKHVKKHIPGILREFQRLHPQVKTRLTAPLGPDPNLLDILDQRSKAADGWARGQDRRK